MLRYSFGLVFDAPSFAIPLLIRLYFACKSFVLLYYNSFSQKCPTQRDSIYLNKAFFLKYRYRGHRGL